RSTRTRPILPVSGEIELRQGEFAHWGSRPEVKSPEPGQASAVMAELKPQTGRIATMARQDALLRLHKNLLARRSELRKRLGLELEELAHVKHSSASGDAADAAFDA